MRYLPSALAIAVTLAACQPDGSTGPRQVSVPGLNAATNVSISGKGTATQVNSATIVTEASFQCPEGQTALITVAVYQPSDGGDEINSAFEKCKEGPNTVVVDVGHAPGWDIARVYARWSITMPPSVFPEDRDEKWIMILAP